MSEGRGFRDLLKTFLAWPLHLVRVGVGFHLLVRRGVGFVARQDPVEVWFIGRDFEDDFANLNEIVGFDFLIADALSVYLGPILALQVPQPEASV